MTGVQIARTGAFTQPSVRGVTTLISGIGFDNNVAVYIDGFYQSDALSINADLANIQSVEVLKGPQGTLYGRNATGGAILINTLAPAQVRAVSKP
jgi:iron complex outermembrane receptor protein